MQTRHASIRPIALVLLLTILAACSGSSGPLGSVPVVTGSAEPSVAQGSPDLTPEPSEEPSDDPSSEPTAPTSSASPSAAPSGGTTGTTVVRAYLWLGGKPGSAGVVAVLRQVPGTKTVATAAITALLAGPTNGEKSRSISTQVPEGTQLLGLTIEAGVATIDLSSEFAAGGAGDAYQARLAQVVYTLTQFPTVKAVSLRIEGKGDSNTLDRADYVQLLPAIWVDRPADGAAIGNPARVTGSADVFEATFRIAILDGSGKVLVDQQAMATCGTGCRGTFDTTVAYTIGKAQYGIFRVYEPSAQDGSPQNIRDYRVWLTPKS